MSAALAGGLLAPTASGVEPTSSGVAAVTPAGMAEGMPLAALRPEPELPRPSEAAWPFPEAFPRTSGTGRLAAGSLQWSDFLYDDKGAVGVWADYPIVGLAPSAGTYTYVPSGFAPNPTHESRYNGADIFRVGIGADAEATYWRVDWNTLAEPRFPIAQFGIDLDGSGGPAVAWPAGAGVRTSGLDRTILVSSVGAWLIDPATPNALTPVTSLGGSSTVDVDTRSFLVRIPRSALAVGGTSKVWVASGVAVRSGTNNGSAFAPVAPSNGGRPGLPAVYNVGFRTYDHEKPANNFWMEQAQAEALTTGDITAFAAEVTWADLDAGTTEPEPQPTGVSNRWYVSSLQDLGPRADGQGAAPDPRNNVQDVRPNFFGRVQPYSIYVPERGDDAAADRPYGLTWILHSLAIQHNQYAAVNPNFLEQACQAHDAICVTPLGRGPDGWYFDEAELDFWEVWNRVAATYPLDPARTVLSGYSMGGYGTYKLGLAYPDLFAAAVVLAGPHTCGVRVSGAVQTTSTTSGPCAQAGDTAPLVGNARWLPYTIAHGALDQLVPVTSVVEQAERFQQAGYRHRFELYPAADHGVWAVADVFGSAAERMRGTVEEAPGHITYSWYPQLVRADWGLGATGAWWVRQPVARGTTRATVDAVTSHLPGAGAPQTVVEPIAGADRTAGVARETTWGSRPGASGASPDVTLALTNVRSVGVDLGRAGIATGTDALVRVQRSEADTAVTLLGLAPGSRVLRNGQLIDTAPPSGALTVVVPASTVQSPTDILVEAMEATVLTLAVADEAHHTDPLEVTAHLATAGGSPLAGRPVTLRLGDTTSAATTDADGVARTTFVVDVDPGELTVDATFDGEPGFGASAASATIVVFSEVTVLTYVGDTRGHGETIRVAAVLTEDDGPALAGRTIVFSVGDSQVSATTDATGRAEAVLHAPGHGRRQTVTIVFPGAVRFSGSRVETEVTWGGRRA